MTWLGKVRQLQARGLSYLEACKEVGRHGAAARKAKKKIGGMVEAIRQHQNPNGAAA